MAKGRKKRKEKRKFSTVSIPVTLHGKIKKRIKGTGFTSVSSYVIYVLREVIASEEAERKEPFTKEDEEKIKARLRALVYLE